MEHVAIMKKSWNLIPKILTGQKKIESRWSNNKILPWGRVQPGDTVYFKNSGGPVVVKASVLRVLEFSDLSPKKVKTILNKFGGDGRISVPDLNNMFRWAKYKRYCTLIYLHKPEKVKPFIIDKSGFGIASAWITVRKIRKIVKVS